MMLDEAVAKAKARAQGNCKRCRREAEFAANGNWARFVGSYSSDPPTKPDHTCHGDLEVVKDGMLAAVAGYWKIGDANVAAAEIERLFEGGHHE